MLNRIRRYLRISLALQRVNGALARAAATSSLRTIDDTNPLSWEFCGFSQNCEDGIIDFLTRKLIRPNRYFIEVGSSYGTENNTSWLAIARKYNGLMIEADEKAFARLSLLFSQGLGIDVQCLKLMVTPKNVDQILSITLFKDPDVFSLDIDGNDYYVAKAFLESGLRPKICVVEYNSAYGPRKSLTISYQENLGFLKQSENRLYYGASIAGWKSLFERFEYKFITVESQGVNAFFVNPKEFSTDFVQNLRGSQFQENFSQLKKFRATWERQFETIKDKEFVTIL
jgi:hypothetical protein